MNDEEIRIYLQAIATNTKATAESIEALRKDLLGDDKELEKEVLPPPPPLKVEDAEGDEVTL